MASISRDGSLIGETPREIVKRILLLLTFAHFDSLMKKYVFFYFFAEMGND